MLNTIQASNAILVLVAKYNKNTSNCGKKQFLNRLISFKLLHRQFKNTIDFFIQGKKKKKNANTWGSTPGGKAGAPRID